MDTTYAPAANAHLIRFFQRCPADQQRAYIATLSSNIDRLRARDPATLRDMGGMCADDDDTHEAFQAALVKCHWERAQLFHYATADLSGVPDPAPPALDPEPARHLAELLAELYHDAGPSPSSGTHPGAATRRWAQTVLAAHTHELTAHAHEHHSMAPPASLPAVQSYA